MLLVICGNYNGLIHSFLRDRDQKDVFNGQSWNCSHIKVGASRGLILEPLLFLVFINDLPEGLTTSANIFADDTLFYSVLMILQHLQYLLIMTYLKFLVGLPVEDDA